MASNIVLFASEIASVCELHPYRKVHETFAGVLKRISVDIETNDDRIETMIKKIDINDTIATLIEEAASAESIEEVKVSVKQIDSIVPKSTEDDLKLIDSVAASETLEEANAAIQSIKDTIPNNAPEVATLIKEALVAKTVTEVKEVAKKIKAAIPETISKSDRQAIVKSIESQMNRQFGTKQEAPTIKQYEEQQKASVGKRNDKFYKRKITSIDGCSIFVGGKVDGIKEDGTVIEVKNRMRRFFDPLPEYDVIQLQTYLFVLKASKGELVEQLKGSKANIKTTEVEVDADMWDTIESRVISFCKALIAILDDQDLLQKFKSGSELDREHIVDSLL